MLIFVSLLGALMNKIRGGLLAALYAKRLVRLYHIPFDTAEKQAEGIFKFFGKHIHHLVFALVFTIIISPEFLVQKLICFGCLSLGMLAASCVGWGNYINALIDGKIDRARRDAMLSDEVFFNLVSWPTLAGFTALSVRGLTWMWYLMITSNLIISFGIKIPIDSFIAMPVGLLVGSDYYSIPTELFSILPIGLLMGPAYLLAMEICQRIPGMNRGNGWQIGEYFWGFILWGSLAFLLGV